jgi:hypothetical protein
LTVGGVTGKPVGPGESVLVIGHEEVESYDLLAEVVDVHGLGGFVFCFGYGSHQERSKDGDNGDDYQQFDKGEGCVSAVR